MFVDFDSFTVVLGFELSLSVSLQLGDCLYDIRLSYCRVSLFLLDFGDEVYEFSLSESLGDAKRCMIFEILIVKIDLAVLKQVFVNRIIIAVLGIDVEHIIINAGDWRLVSTVVKEEFYNPELNFGVHFLTLFHVILIFTCYHHKWCESLHVIVVLIYFLVACRVWLLLDSKINLLL